MHKTATADAAMPGPRSEGTAAPTPAQAVVFPILITLSFCHLLNDVMQSLIPALYPLLKQELHLDFTQLGLITLATHLTASLLQPTVGMWTDRKPQPYSLAIGMGSTLIGLILLSVAGQYATVLLAAALVGIGSAVFHPEASRVARLAAGQRYGFSQALFQVGGNVGSAAGPLLAAFLVLPRGQGAIAWVSLIALLAIIMLTRVGSWYSARLQRPQGAARASAGNQGVARGRAIFLVSVLMLLVFSKHVYSSSLTSFFAFYLIDRFQLSVQAAQVQLFIFMAAIAVGTLVGGTLTDRVGRLPMIWISILGALPFTLALPYANLFWTSVLIIIIGLLMASAFPAILVYAYELLPGRVGLVSGAFFGAAFGMGGLGAALVGAVADARGIVFAYQLCSYLPVIGLAAWLLPNLERERRAA